MISSIYQIDYSGWFDEGGYCQVYTIKNKKKIVFKEFRNKKKAQESYKYHKKLAKFDLAPKIFSPICKLTFAYEDDIYQPESSDWGYVMEKASPINHSDRSMLKIQELVDAIKKHTGLKFWDSHWYNVGTIIRNKRKKIVCIDTGKESFDGDSNAWGNITPGPKCVFCQKYNCEC